MSQETCIKDAEKFEDKYLFYAVKDKDKLNKNISIFGGGDSALDWALELSKFSKINLIHREKNLEEPHTLSEIKKLENDGKIFIKTPCQLESIDGKNNIDLLQNLTMERLKILKQILF